ncbi:MAG: YfiR family protein [Rhodocyclaceae bacterium]|nr:YfiR family protein [Rhodocyclaceae bacterium]
MRTLRKRLRLLLLGGLLAASPLWAAPTEYQLKAVFLLNFARYVTWPVSALPPDQPLDICVLGRDPFGIHLSGLEARQAQGRAVKVRYPDSVDAAAGCAVVFIAASEQRRLNAVLRALSHQPVLTVSDIDGFVEAGGGIGLVTEDDRIRFDINRATLARDQLTLSAQLLKLARRLVGDVER